MSIKNLSIHSLENSLVDISSLKNTLLEGVYDEIINFRKTFHVRNKKSGKIFNTQPLFKLLMPKIEKMTHPRLDFLPESIRYIDDMIYCCWDFSSDYRFIKNALSRCIIGKDVGGR